MLFPFRVVIPARYASSRLPGKMLADIGGKPMLQHVHARALESGAHSVVIATDDTRIQKAAEAFGATVCMTAAHHPTGTDRIAEVASTLGYLQEDIIVNVQGDEPFIPPALIRQVAEDLHACPRAHLTTLYTPIQTGEALFNPHHAKVVMDKEGYALYFSRAPIAWDRDHFPPADKNAALHTPHFRHIGLYAFRAGFLQQYTQWEVSPLEEIEKLEQLRILWHGGHIHLTQAQEKVPGDVNTAEDLKIAQASIR